MRRPTLPLTRCFAFLAAAFWIILAWTHVAQACDIAPPDTTSQRQVISCGDAVQIEREPTAELQIIKNPNEDAPRVIEVQGGAILITVSPGQAPTQVRTPHAIATVRGTTYIVDAGTEQSSVFVLEGGVDVRRTNDASTFTLFAGDGMDATLDAPLVIQEWGAARAQALLARFGR